MAQRSIADLVINLRMSTASFVKELDKSRTLSTAFGTAVGVTMAGIGASAARMAVDVATSIPRAFLAAADSADELFKSSQKIGISVEALSGLKHAADLSGISFQQLETGVARLSRNMRDSISGTNAASKAFIDLGVDVRNQDGTFRTTEDVLRDLAERFSKMPDGANKTALAMTLLGRAGAQMIPFLNQGAAGLDRMLKEAEKLGLVISTKTAMAAEAFNDNLQRLKGALTGVTTQMAADLLPLLESVTGQMVAFAKDGDKVRIVSDLLSDSIRGLAQVFVFFAKSAIASVSAASFFSEKLREIELDARKFARAGWFGLFNLGVKEAEERTKRQGQASQELLGVLESLDILSKQLAGTLPLAFVGAGASGKKAGTELGKGIVEGADIGSRVKSLADQMSKESARIKLNVKIDPIILQNIEREFSNLSNRVKEGIGKTELETLTLEFENLKQSLNLGEAFSSSLRPSEELHQRIEQLAEMGAQTADILRVFGSEIVRANESQRGLGKTIASEMQAWEDVIQARNSYIEQAQDIVQENFRLAQLPITLEKLRLEAQKLPGIFSDVSTQVRDLGLEFSEALPEVASQVEAIDEGFRNLGLASAFDLSGITAIAKRDFRAIGDGGESSGRQIAESFFDAQEAIKNALSAGLGKGINRSELDALAQRFESLQKASQINLGIKLDPLIIQNIENEFNRLSERIGKGIGQVEFSSVKSQIESLKKSMEIGSEFGIEVRVDAVALRNLEEEFKSLTQRIAGGVESIQLGSLAEQFEALNQSLNISETLSSSLRPSEELRDRLTQIAAVGSQTAEVLRQFSAEIISANEAQRVAGQPVTDEMQAWEDVIRSRAEYLEQAVAIVQANQLSLIPDNLAQLPGIFADAASAVSELDLQFANVLPKVVDQVAAIDAAFERMGLISGFELSGIAAQAQTDFQDISASGQASARQSAEAFVRAQEAIKAAAESGFRTWTREQEKALRAGQKELEALTDSASRTRERFQDLAHTLSSGFESAILGGKGLRDTLAGILEDIGRIILRATVTGPDGILGTLLTGLGAAVGGLFGGGGGGLFAGSGGGFAAGTRALTGARAMGGPVEAGRSYLVGEMGPERFVPEVSGHIVPNIATASREVNVVTNQNITVNTGARPEEVIRLIQIANQSAVAQAVEVIVQRQLRSA